MAATPLAAVAFLSLPLRTNSRRSARYGLGLLSYPWLEWSHLSPCHLLPTEPPLYNNARPLALVAVGILIGTKRAPRRGERGAGRARAWYNGVRSVPAQRPQGARA